jgi:23S rRNA (cytosine1962-C5)-methyltransferase
MFRPSHGGIILTAEVSEAAEVILRKREERRLLAGHLWVYANEVDTARTPLSALSPGQKVSILSHQGRWLGYGYANPHSLICARIVSRDRSHPFDASLITHRFNVALGLRDRLYDRPFYRLIYGESDGLPGLIVDRYGDLAVVQISTAGMESCRDDVLLALEKSLRPKGVLLRCDNEIRRLEGLDLYVDSVGEVPETVELVEHDTRFAVTPRGGQKTGWFFDQRDNRALMLPLWQGRRVLDVCSYAGAWGVQAARHGAASALCLDSSPPALDQVLVNAELNGVGAAVEALRADAFQGLKDLRAGQREFDVVVLDPPAFIKRKKDYRSGCEAYQRLNRLALQVLSRDGLLVTCSCSYHLERGAFLEIVHKAARHIDRTLQVLAEGGQAMDHPFLPAMPETRYLKCLLLRVLPRG